jgi:hypothetical protein
MRKHWKKLLIAMVVAVPGLAWAGMELSGMCAGICPFCN